MFSDTVEIKNLLVERSKDFTLSISDFQMKKASVVGLVGNNGAGKTTFLLALLDLITCSFETLRLHNLDWMNNSVNIKKRLGVYLDETYMIDYMTVSEYFDFIRRIYKTDPHDFNIRKKTLTEKLALADNKKIISQLSAGSGVKAGLIGSLLHNPGLVIWDEPFVHLDAWSRRHLIDIILKTNKENLTSFIVSSHNIEELYEFSSHFLCLQNGRVIADQPKAALPKKEILKSLGIVKQYEEHP